MTSQDLAYRVNELYHDFQAPEFDAIHRRRHRVERVFWASTVAPRLLRDRAVQGVDLCCGTGFVAGILLPVLPAAHILCVDLSSGPLEQARTALGERASRATFHVGDAADIPADDGTMDWVSMNAGLHHMPDPPAVLAEIDRVLKVGGLFCLGHEPNAAFFSSSGLVAVERAIWHVFWYCSLAQNRRRVKRLLGRSTGGQEGRENLDRINRALIDEGLIDGPLGLDELRALVDVHTGSGDDEHEAGFSVADLLKSHLPNYDTEELLFGDYGGDMLRKYPHLRGAFDGVMRAVFPRKGRLFSWILRKRAGRGSAP